MIIEILKKLKQTVRATIMTKIPYYFTFTENIWVNLKAEHRISMSPRRSSKILEIAKQYWTAIKENNVKK